MNVFDFINQYKKSNVSTYGDLLENKFNPENDLSGAEKSMYNQLKVGDIITFISPDPRFLLLPQL